VAVYNLESLKKIHDGTLKPARRRDIRAGLPFFTQYVRHDQPEVMAAFLEEILIDARQAGGVQAEREAYWRTIKQIGDQANWARAVKTENWILDRHLGETLRFPFHAQEDVQVREKEIRADMERRGTDKSDIPELGGKSELASNIQFFFRYAAVRLDRDSALKAAKVLARHFGDLEEPQGILPDLDNTVDWLPDTAGAEKFSRLLDICREADDILGFTGTPEEIIKRGFLAAQGNDVHPEVQKFFSDRAKNLSIQDKKEILEDHMSMFKRSRDENLSDFSGDHSFGWKQAFFILEGEELDRLLTEVKRWDVAHRTSRFRSLFFKRSLEPFLSYGERTSGKGVLDDYLIERHFAPTFAWSEIKRRLEMLMPYAGRDMKAITFDEQPYLVAALSRALSLGHPEDLKDVLEYCRSLSPKEREKRKFTGDLPHALSYRAISRHPEILRELRGALSGDEESLGIIENILTFVRPGSDPDDFHRAKCSYLYRGKAMARDKIMSGLGEALYLMDSVTKTAQPEHKKWLISSLFLQGRGKRNTMTTILQSRDAGALALWVDAYYAAGAPKKIDPHGSSFLDEVFENLITQTQTYEDLSLPTEFLKFVKRRDPEHFKKFLSEIYEQAGSGWRIANVFLAHSFFDDLSAEERKQFDTPVHNLLKKKMKEVLSGDLWQIVATCQKEISPERAESENRFNQELYEDLLPLLKMVQDKEGNHAAEDNAKKLAWTFPTFHKADSFVRRHAQPGRQPLHDLCLFQPPVWSQDRDIWSNLAVRYGQAVTKYFGLAGKIEEYIARLNEKRVRIDRDILGKPEKEIGNRELDLWRFTPAMIRAVACKVGYDRALENKKAADFCLNLGVSERHFNETLDLLAEFEKAAKKVKDKTPFIDIDGKKLGLDGYRMTKVPKGDIRNLWIGKMVNCCNHLEDAGRDMALAQFARPRNALYVITDRRGRPVAKLSGWLSDKGNLVFNAWERLSEEQDYLMVRFVQAAGIEVLKTHQKISYVMLGAGPLKKEAVPFSSASIPETPAKGAGSTFDSAKQFEVANCYRLKEAEHRLEREIANAPQRGEVRVKMTLDERRNGFGW
jgi:hypothetical protein